MSVVKIPRTYVLYAEKDKLSVSEENSFESYSAENSDKIQEIARQSFLFPQVGNSADSDDLAELIPDLELRLSFINKNVNSKLLLHVNKIMKEAESVKSKNEQGVEEVSLKPLFVAQSTPIDLTEIVGQPPKRERLTQDVKIKRLLGDMSKEDQVKFLNDMLAAMQAESESESESESNEDEDAN